MDKKLITAALALPAALLFSAAAVASGLSGGAPADGTPVAGFGGADGADFGGADVVAHAAVAYSVPHVYYRVAQGIGGRSVLAEQMEGKPQGGLASYAGKAGQLGDGGLEQG